MQGVAAGRCVLLLKRGRCFSAPARDSLSKPSTAHTEMAMPRHMQLSTRTPEWQLLRWPGLAFHTHKARSAAVHTTS